LDYIKNIKNGITKLDKSILIFQPIDF